MMRSLAYLLKAQLISLTFLLLISYFTYVHNYGEPAALFWDENYHIASAQKYLNGIFFMEPHPPLGKLLIALGEKLLHPNIINDQFIAQDYIKNIPVDFSFKGYRFIPVFLAWLTAPLVFEIFLVLTKNYIFAILLSSLYIFDNALIVHSRGAMLDSILLFFLVLTILLFLFLLKWKNFKYRFIYCSILFGISFGFLTTTKVTGFILILLFPALLIKLLPDWRKAINCLSLSAFSSLITFVMVWQVHFTLTSQVISYLPNNGYYGASLTYQRILQQGQNHSLLYFPVMLRDSLQYMYNYSKGVPQLDLCKPGENGSPPFFWPLGARAINYRWETTNGKEYRYLYLQANPVVWGIGLLGIVLASAIIFSSLLLPLGARLQNRFLLTTFLVLYAAYMLGMSRIHRVLYLYHYFPGLLFSFFLFALVFMEIKQLSKWKLNQLRKTLILIILTACIFFSYEFYRPLTYYKPITEKSFQQRSILPLWDLRCINCR